MFYRLNMCDDDDIIENWAYLVHAITITSGYICRDLTKADRSSYIVIILY